MKATSDQPKPNAESKAEPGSKPASAPGAKSDAQKNLKSIPMEELQKKLGSSPDGLSEAEAKKRLTQYGPNEIAEKKENPYLKFLTYFWGPIPWMIEGAVILSGVVRHWPDFFIILLLLVSNAVVGFWEEHQAGNAIAALRKQLAIKAKVKRDGKWTDPSAKELVPGDVIRLKLGDIVPADARLLPGDPVRSGPVRADRRIFTRHKKAGRRGIFRIHHSSGRKRRNGLCNRRTDTYFGKTAQMVQGPESVSHFQKAVLKIGDYLIVLAVVLVAVIVTVALFRHDPVMGTLEFALVLLVAAIPVAMPTVLSVTMAVGARLLAKKQAIVTRLSAIEELAGVDILCSDKTGTLTLNKLTLGDPFTLKGMPGDQVILCAALASRAEDKDTIDLAVIGGVKDRRRL